MKGFRVECQQLGTARTETVARPGECRRIGHATKLHSLKSHNTHEDPRFGGPIPVTVGTFETKVRPLRGFRALPLGGGGGVPTRDTRPYSRYLGGWDIFGFELLPAWCGACRVLGLECSFCTMESI